MAELRACVFLDRDNTMVANDGDLGDPDAVVLLPGVAWAVRALHEAGYAIVVVTNQGGVARGKYRERDVAAVHARIADRLAAEADLPIGTALVDGWYHCPYHPDATVEQYRREHPWRKPAPGMLHAAAEDLGIDLARSWMVGDKERDVAAGQAAGCRAILLEHDDARLAESRAASAAEFVERDALHAAYRILRADGRDRGPRWERTSGCMLHARAAALDDAMVQDAVRAAAIALAEREGVTLAQLDVDACGVRAQVQGAEIVALGFAAELARATNRWAHAHGLGTLWGDGA
jgi:D-glycero-D-manno-heptose 1,7-bisphosphate phosphatase